MPTLTPAEVAADLRLPNTESALRLMRAGTLPAFRVGRWWRVDADELAEWKAKRAARPADPNRVPPRSPRSQAAIGRSRKTSSGKSRG